MKILYIITQADGGGAQKYVLTLAKYFGGKIAAGAEDKKLFNDAITAGIRVYPLGHLKRNISPVSDILAIWEIRNLIKNLNPDIVHLNSTKAGVLGSFAAIGLKTKVVFTAHGFRFNEPMSYPIKNFYLALEKIASSCRDFIITVSDADKESALKNKLIDYGKISTVHNGISPINFFDRDQARAKLNLPTDKKIVGTIANFYKTKGIDVLIEAVNTLPKSTLEKTLFMIIGDGTEFENLKLRIKNLKLENNIRLMGKIDNASIYLKAFDAFVLPSRKEGFPFAILEAMQASLPIIAADVGGNKEALGDTGILVPSENPDALSRVINTVLRDSNTVRSISGKTFERSKLFTEEKMLEETKNVYEKVLKNG
jgi:glycosyltransferase involved in cell wall biosynthesis